MTQILEDLAADRLAGAMESIRNPRDWCQDGMSKDRDGNSVLPKDAQCAQRCALGSVMALSTGPEDPVFRLAAGALETESHRQTPGYGTVATNDRLPAEEAHRKLMAIFPAAIERLRAIANRRKMAARVRHPAAVWSALMLTGYSDQYARGSLAWRSPTGRVRDGRWVYTPPPSVNRWPKPKP